MTNKTLLCTDEWEFYTALGYKRKFLGYCDCPECGGRGEIGAGWAGGDIETCHRCRGGKIEKEPTEPKPEVPEELVKRLSATYKAYIEELQKTY